MYNKVIDLFDNLLELSFRIIMLSFYNRVAKLKQNNPKETLKLLFSKNEVRTSHILVLCNGGRGR